MWLEQQLSRPTPAAATNRSPSLTAPRFFAVDAFATAPSQQPFSATQNVHQRAASSSTAAYSSPVLQRLGPDTAAGSGAHATWLEQQLRRRQREPVADSSPRQQVSSALPAGVNVLLRGQDASALTHGEWLERQLSKGRASEPLPPSSAHRQKGIAGHSTSPAGPGPPVMPYEPFDRQSGVGSRRHADWLQCQLDAASRMRP